MAFAPLSSLFNDTCYTAGIEIMMAMASILIQSLISKLTTGVIPLIKVILTVFPIDSVNN
ncbi:hypothetical protein EGJ58_13840 [Brucella anthropi]|nr:hypothetical protein EGJ58_13840 [Brucella anthropi]